MNASASAGKSKIAKAREKKRGAQAPQTVAQAVAATVKPKSPPADAKPIVKNVLLPQRVVMLGNLRINEFLGQSGRGLSWSALTEVALLELLDREDFNDVIERYGARARRPDVK